MEKAKHLQRGQLYCFSLPFPTPPYAQMLEPSGQHTGVWGRGEIQVHALFLHWRLQAWGSDEVLPLNQF